MMFLAEVFLFYQRNNTFCGKAFIDLEESAQPDFKRGNTADCFLKGAESHNSVDPEGFKTFFYLFRYINLYISIYHNL